MAEKLQYPLEASDEYRGKIQFSVASSKPTGIETTITRATAAVIDAAVAAFNGDEENKKSTAQPSRDVSGGDVTLYLPPGLQYRDNVAYEGVDLGLVGALAEGSVGIAQGFLENTQSVIEGLKGDAIAGSNDVAKLVGLELAKLNPRNLLGAGVREGLQTNARLQAGVTLNPNTRVLFKRVGLREFAFSFKLIAKSDKEAVAIEEIVKFFRTQLYPETFSVSGVGVGYRFPEPFNIEISYQGSEGTWFAPKIKSSYLKDVGLTYNATSMSFHKDGKPMEVDLTLSFMESAALERNDIKAGY